MRYHARFASLITHHNFPRLKQYFNLGSSTPFFQNHLQQQITSKNLVQQFSSSLTIQIAEGIKTLKGSGDHENAERVFLKALTKPKIQFDIQFLSVMATYFAERQRKDTVIQLAEEAVKRKVADARFFTCIIPGIIQGREKDLGYIEKLLEIASRSQVTADTIYLNNLLEAYAYIGEVIGLIDCIKTHVSAGVAMDDFTYGFLLTGLKYTPLSNTLIYVASSLLSDTSVRITEDLEFILFDALMRHTDISWEPITELFTALTKTIPPSIRVANKMLGIYNSRGKPELSIRLFEDMLKQKEVDEYSFHFYIQSLALCKRLDDIPPAMRKMKELGFEILEVTFHDLLTAYGKRGSLTNMLNLFEVMKDTNITKSSDYATIVQAFCYKGNLVEGKKYYDEAKEQNKLDEKSIMWMMKAALLAKRETLLISLMEDLLSLPYFRKQEFLGLLEQNNLGHQNERFQNALQQIRDKKEVYRVRSFKDNDPGSKAK